LATVIALSNSEIAPSTLAHQLGRGRVVGEGAGIVVCRNRVDASFAQLGVTDFLRPRPSFEANQEEH
jgi:hypothetical protein